MKKNIRYLALAASLAVSFSATAAETDSYQGSWYALPGISYNLSLIHISEPTRPY